MGSQPEKVNPFAEAAAAGAATEALKRIEWEMELNRREAHLKACEAIMKVGVLPRLELAAEAVRQWGNKAEVIGVTRSETFSGTVHFRAKLIVDEGTGEMRYLEFIASPKSMVIASEGEKAHEKRRWQKICLTADGISNDSDRIISGFLTWGWMKRE
jgi:hypothetical protein